MESYFFYFLLYRKPPDYASNSWVTIFLLKMLLIDLPCFSILALHINFFFPMLTRLHCHRNIYKKNLFSCHRLGKKEKPQVGFPLVVRVACCIWFYISTVYGILTRCPVPLALSRGSMIDTKVALGTLSSQFWWNT